MTGESTLRMRSVNKADPLDKSWGVHSTAVSPDDFLADDAEAPGRGPDDDDKVNLPPPTGDGAHGPGRSSNDAGDPEPMKLPPSTHSLLFTQPVRSLPFAFATGIVVMSNVCLVVAFWNNMDLGNLPREQVIANLPVNVSATVRAAQYFGIFIVLLMEEEIPTGIHLLRMIPRPTFQEQFPDLNYRRFIFSSVLRMVTGYLFLVNVFVVLAQATEVIAIFYDVLALQFIQQLDDIAFALAKMDVLGKGMKRACTAACFQAEFQRKKSGRSLRSKKFSIFLKTLYFLNLTLFLALMAAVSIRQNNGSYQVDSITVDFGNVIWEDALVKMPSAFHEKWLELYPWYEDDVTPDEFEKWTLVFSYFNGVYQRDPNMTINRRPVYNETRKFSRTTLQKAGALRYEVIVPAAIYYCKGIKAWVFAHEYIQKSKETDQKGCNWLLRSEETEEYDLMNVDTKWKVWNGVIGKAEVFYVDNQCSEDTDCNLNGRCGVDGKCQCNKNEDDEVEYFGTHCETSLKHECQTIIGENNDETFSIVKYNSDGDPDGPLDAIDQQYSRPRYFYVSGVPVLDLAGDGLVLSFTGNRWFGYPVPLDAEDVISEIHSLALIVESHAFWERAFTPGVTALVSDETKKDTPVGVDFYWVEKTGGQFGPFGALDPLQLHNQTGRGFFRCGGPLSSLGNVSSSGRRLQFQNIRGNNWP